MARKPLLFAALFAIFWAVLRAYRQSITIDEAFTYLFFVARPIRWVFLGSSNNHVLNSLLMWITTHAFGTSTLTVRAPALLGAVIYIFTCKFLTEAITERFSLQLPVFICLTYNPFIADYLVAARGYSLADAFLLLAIAIPVWHHVKRRPSLQVCCACASFALALSFTANFGFAFVDFATFLAILIWAALSAKSFTRVVAWCTLPGLCVAILLCRLPLTHWPPHQIWDGAHSLSETMQSLAESSFFQLSPRLQAFSILPPLLLSLLALLCAAQVAVSRFVAKSTAALAAILTLSVAMSWIAFRLGKVPLPVGRTAIYLVPLLTLLVATIAAGASPWLRRGLAGVLITIACYFILCLRLSYFKEYQWDADLKDVYPVLAKLNHETGVTDIEVTGFYVIALNYYRALSGQETFPEFKLDVPELNPGRSVYVLDGVLWRDFIDQQNLAIIYRGNFSNVVVAVREARFIKAL